MYSVVLPVSDDTPPESSLGALLRRLLGKRAGAFPLVQPPGFYLAFGEVGWHLLTEYFPLCQ